MDSSWNSFEYYQSSKNWNFYLTSFISTITATIDLLIALSLFSVFIKKQNSILKNPYFYFLFVGHSQKWFTKYLWQIQLYCYYDTNSVIKYPIFFIKESWPGFDSCWTLILSINRCFAIGFPILNRKASLLAIKTWDFVLVGVK